MSPRHDLLSASADFLAPWERLAWLLLTCAAIGTASILMLLVSADDAVFFVVVRFFLLWFFHSIIPSPFHFKCRDYVPPSNGCCCC